MVQTSQIVWVIFFSFSMQGVRYENKIRKYLEQQTVAVKNPLRSEAFAKTSEKKYFEIVLPSVSTSHGYLGE